MWFGILQLAVRERERVCVCVIVSGDMDYCSGNSVTAVKAH